MNKLICQICEKEFKSYKGLSFHISKGHKIKVKYYYDIYLKKINEEMCNNDECVNTCNFANINYGYYKYCCRSCRNKSIEGRKISSRSSQSMWNDTNSSYHSENRSNKLKQKFIKLWSDPNSIFRTEEYINKKKQSLIKSHKNPNSGYNTKEYRKFRSDFMKDGGSSHCHKFITNPSKPQVALFKLCQELLPYPILNYPCLNYSIDIAIPKLNIAIEYDGSYWHQDKEYDKKRQTQIEDEGWKFIRYEDYIPYKHELLETTNEVLKNV